MKKLNRNTICGTGTVCVSALVALLLMTGVASAAPSLVWLGSNYPSDLNADGTVVVGNMPGTFNVFRWTADTGVVELGQSTSETFGGGGGTPDVSDNGLHVSASVVDADTTYQTQGIWTKGIGWEYSIPPIPPEGGVIDNSVASAWGLSGDGTTVTGFFWRPGHGGPGGSGSAHANTWSRDDGTFTHLPSPLRNCRGNDTNYDGTMVVGWSERTDGVWCPTVWEDGGVLQLNTRDQGSQVEGVSPDETIIYGSSVDTLTNIVSAAIWIRDGMGGWTEQILGTLPGTFPVDGYVTCHDITADNSIIVGYNQLSQFDHTAFVWTLAEGLMSAEDYFTARGVDLPVGYDYGDVTGVSDDGNVYTGIAWDKSTFPYTPHGYLITLNDVSATPEISRYAGVTMGANYPNPFNPVTSIPVTMDKDGSVTLKIFDARGRVVRVLHDGILATGRHELVWDGRDEAGLATASGIYMARVSDRKGLIQSRRMMLVK